MKATEVYAEMIKDFVVEAKKAGTLTELYTALRSNGAEWKEFNENQISERRANCGSDTLVLTNKGQTYILGIKSPGWSRQATMEEIEQLVDTQGSKTFRPVTGPFWYGEV